MASPKQVFCYCPRCGEKTFSAQSEQLMACGNCKLNFYLNAAAAVAAIIIDEKGKILFTRRAAEPHAGMLDLPGGFLELGETAEQAVIRELKEELNLEIENLKYFSSSANVYEYKEITYHTVDIAYTCKVSDFEKLLAQDDVQDYVFLYPDEIDLNQVAFPSIKNFIQKYMEDCNG